MDRGGGDIKEREGERMKQIHRGAEMRREKECKTKEESKINRQKMGKSDRKETEKENKMADWDRVSLDVARYSRTTNS